MAAMTTCAKLKQYTEAGKKGVEKGGGFKGGVGWEMMAQGHNGAKRQRHTCNATPSKRGAPQVGK